MLEVANMEDRDYKLDIGVVANTVDRRLAASLAEGILLTSSLKDI